MAKKKLQKFNFEYKMAKTVGEFFEHLLKGYVMVDCDISITVEVFSALKERQNESDLIRHTYAMFLCAGKGCNANEEKAVAIYQELADKGFALSINALGACYGVGTGVEKDCEKAFKLYEKASALGSATANYNLAVVYLSGNDYAPKNEKTALKYLKKAVEQKYAYAYTLMGKCYLKGLGVATNLTQAKAYFKLGASSGDYNAEWFLERYFSK